MNVAPLKLFFIIAAWVYFKRFPRLNERGSIEANSKPDEMIILIEFPRLNERGSIEALRVRDRSVN